MTDDIERIEYSEGMFDCFKNEQNLDQWIELGFDLIMWGLGYEMDCSESFQEYIDASPLKVKTPNSEREKKRNYLYYLEHAPRQIVGNYLFSYWRYLTHWSYSYDKYDVDYLIRIIAILEKLYAEENKIESIDDFAASMDFPKMKYIGESENFKYYVEIVPPAKVMMDVGIPIVTWEYKYIKRFGVCESEYTFSVLAYFEYADSNHKADAYKKLLKFENDLMIKIKQDDKVSSLKKNNIE